MSGVLAPMESVTIAVTVAIDNTSITSNLSNQATATGTFIDIAGNPVLDGIGNPVLVTDLSDAGTDPTTNNGAGGMDDPTLLQEPAVGLTKAVTSSAPAIGGAAEEYVVQYEIIVQNTGTTLSILLLMVLEMLIY